MKKLTKAEEQIMQILWQLGKAFVKEVIAEFPDLENKKPKYTTVATVLKVLETKGFVAYQTFGNSHQYYALITQEQYSDFAVKDVMGKYFDGSLTKLVSFFVKKKQSRYQRIGRYHGLDRKTTKKIKVITKSKSSTNLQ